MHGLMVTETPPPYTSYDFSGVLHLGLHPVSFEVYGKTPKYTIRHEQIQAWAL